MNQMFCMPGRVDRWDTPTVAALSHIEPQVLLAWRRKYGFLGGSQPGRQGTAGGYTHTMMDIFVAAATADIVRRGIDPSDAAVFEGNLRATFKRLMDGGSWPSIIGLYPRHRDEPRHYGCPFWTLADELSIAEALARSPTGTMLVVDLKPIMDRVAKELKVTP